MTSTGARSGPPAETRIDADLVRALLHDQHADLADLPLVEVDAGWDNVIFRLGDDLAVRMPRRAISAPFAEQEHRWLPVLAPRLTLPIPAPLRIGQPGHGYPWSWSVCPWLPGVRAADVDGYDTRAAAEDLAAFLRSLHQPAPPDAPDNPYRSADLTAREPALRDRTDRLAGVVDQALVDEIWSAALAAPSWSGPPVWVHGDLHPANVLVESQRFSAVIDFGDLTAGDPATDLAAGWMFFDPADREHFKSHMGADDATWTRARGWALILTLAFLAECPDHPSLARIGHHTLTQLGCGA